MLLHEYQSKRMLDRCGLSVPKGVLFAGENNVRQNLESLTFPVMVKAQVLTGGRGKAGAVKMARTIDEAMAIAGEILAMIVRTVQNRGEGLPVRSVLIEEACTTKNELYVSMTIDRSLKSPVMVVSARGGIDIEETAMHDPGALLRFPVDPIDGISDAQCGRVHDFLNVPQVSLKATGEMLHCMTKAFMENDATMVEINPMGVTGANTYVVMDAKTSLDDNARFRHPEWQELDAHEPKTQAEIEAARYDLNYIKIPGGSIGCMVNGAGLAMATMDMIALFGSRPANFLDVGGTASTESITAAFRILESDADVRAIFVNIFGGIVKCDLIAEGIISACRSIHIQIPLIVRLEGTHVERAWDILKNSGISCVCVADLAQAAKEMVRLAGG
jgi:succinyl-CoA synthetase beta subunit